MSKLFTTRRRIVIVGITGAVVLGGAGAAFAYFTASGQGTGTGSVGSATSFNVVVGTPTGGPLYPGAGTETFGYTITNTGTGNQGLNTITISVAPDSAAATAGCEASWYNLNNSGQDQVTLNPDVDLAANGTNTGSFTLQLTDVNSSQDGCENDAPVVTLVASS